jgi:hypothetical protein
MDNTQIDMDKEHGAGDNKSDIMDKNNATALVST